MLNRSELAKAVKNRRHQLGLTPDGVRSAGGPSPSVLSQVENAYDNEFSVSTLAKLDRALQWPAGMASALLNGGELPSTTAVNENDLVASIDRLASLIERVIPLLEERVPADRISG